MERRSAAVLLYLHQLPRWLPTLVLGVLLLAGLFVDGVLGAVFVGLVAVFLGWLLYLSWPLLEPRPRGLRLLAVGLLVGLVVAKVAGG